MAPSKTWTRPSAMRSLRVGRIRSGFLAGCLTWPQYAANRHDGAPSGQGSGVGTASPARGQQPPDLRCQRSSQTPSTQWSQALGGKGLTALENNIQGGAYS